MSSTFQNFLKHPPTSLREELIAYHTLAEEAIKALQFFQEGNFSAGETLKKRVSLHNHAYQFGRKATQAKAKWYTLGIPFLYWRYRTRKVERALQSCPK